MVISVNSNIEMRLRTVDEADDVFSVIDNNRKYLREWLPWVDATVSSADCKANISSSIDELEKGTDIVLGIFKDKKYIGNIGLHGLKSTNNSGMIGYWISEKEQGKGIITACVKAIIEYGFNIRKLNRICIHCASPNKKSQSVAERLGFTKEGTIRDGEFLYGKHFDLFVYGMLQREWNPVN